MKAGVCLFLESFSLDKDEYILIQQISELKKLMNRMNSEFTKFCKSNEFDSKLALSLCSTSSDIGGLMSQFYDMGKVEVLSLGCNDLLNVINSIPPLYNTRMLYMYNSKDNLILTTMRDSTIINEEELVMHCRKILDAYPRDNVEYGKNIQDIFKNIIFMNNEDHEEFKTFNSMDRIDGGFENFHKSITEFLFFCNNYEVIPGDSAQNLKNMDSALIYTVCEEGGGKSGRNAGELNRDFVIDKVKYTDINCEFHYKLLYKDGQNRKGKRYSGNRIYFGFFNKIEGQPPRIAISHIGKHL
ncbi:hypothetical protein ABGR78_004682 [Escherichia coli]|uniref:hypothetical protein n=1 Tax=Enterobacteriaceae TaxID=543 RepID=UPI000F8798F1|nr:MULTISPECIES: hypothetical protein [Enterobacteriaceae]EGO3804251.1 hypothetical protein [Escherichia coli]EIS9544309.1 hypothetical protein [Escherichia coli]EJI4390921.1 hypothetical protein [Escherichia coli]MBI9646931.1 hypothetical protein [Escherichia coli]MBW9499867.1 hypothetical protein [Escherichia coli]